MTIETEHLGHKIIYSENGDTWHCYGLDLEAKTLSALKTKIGKWDVAKRRLQNVPVLVLPHNFVFDDVKEGRAVTLDADGEHVWINTASMKYGQTGDRSKYMFERLAPDTPEVRALLDEINTRRATIREMEVAVRAVEASIPRVTPEALMALEQIEDLPPPRKRSRR